MDARHMLGVIWCRSQSSLNESGVVLNNSLKFFMHPDLDDFRKLELLPRFRKVVVDKPKESRKGSSVIFPHVHDADYVESSEAYFVCLGYKG